MSNRYTRIRDELAHAESADPPTALEHLRIVLDEVSALLDEQLAHAVVDEELSLRSAAKKVGLTENAVGPRLGNTSMLAPYARSDGRVTAKEIQQARYDKKSGVPAPAVPDSPSTTKSPMRFKPRRKI